MKTRKEKKLIQKPGSNTAVMTTKELKSLHGALGAKSQEMALHLVNQIANVVHNSSENDPSKSIALGVTLQHAIQPKDELEALLAAQMVGTHHLAMRFLARATLPDQTVDIINANVERATKMMRTFTSQMEALNRYRGKGQQKVTVEHVTVNQGGQAVIGNVERPGGDGGNEKK
jgi:hypothetical protein